MGDTTLLNQGTQMDDFNKLLEEMAKAGAVLVLMLAFWVFL